MITSRRLAVLAAFGLAACGAGDASPTAGEVPVAPATDATPTDDVTVQADGETAATDPAPSANGESGSATIPAALRFSAPLVGGGQLDAGDLADKPTVFWFWSPT